MTLMRILIDNPSTIRLELQPGDELVLQRRTPEVENLLVARRADGARYAHLIDDSDESQTATLPPAGETATTKTRTSRHATRTDAV